MTHKRQLKQKVFYALFECSKWSENWIIQERQLETKVIDGVYTYKIKHSVAVYLPDYIPWLPGTVNPCIPEGLISYWEWLWGCKRINSFYTKFLAKEESLNSPAHGAGTWQTRQSRFFTGIPFSLWLTASHWILSIKPVWTTSPQLFLPTTVHILWLLPSRIRNRNQLKCPVLKVPAGHPVLECGHSPTPQPNSILLPQGSLPSCHQSSIPGVLCEHWESVP